MVKFFGTAFDQYIYKNVFENFDNQKIEF